MSVVGIDFGYQNSVIAAAGRGGVDVILNGNSNRLNPYVLYCMPVKPIETCDNDGVGVVVVHVFCHCSCAVHVGLLFFLTRQKSRCAFCLSGTLFLTNSFFSRFFFFLLMHG